MMPDRKPVILILFGAPGVGKGTQAALLSECYAIPHISTGELYREHLRKDTPLGREVKRYVDQGQIGPDRHVLEMLFERWKEPDCAKGYILDGFPRTLSQVKALSEYLLNNPVTIVVISLEVPDEILIDRLSGRLTCKQCGSIYHIKEHPPRVSGVCDQDGMALIQREDDRAAVVQHRLTVFHEQTAPVKTYYQQDYPFFSVDGTLPKGEIFSHLKTLLNPFLLK